jgi:hypothetical protein
MTEGRREMKMMWKKGQIPNLVVDPWTSGNSVCDNDIG